MQNQCQVSNKRDILSERGIVCKQRPKYFTQVESAWMQTAWSYPIGKYRNRYIQIYFHLANKYCQIMTLVTYGYQAVWHGP